MPRKKLPPRLVLRKEGNQRVWVIRDGQRYVRTRCSEAEMREAGERLAAYLAEARSPDTSKRRASQALIGDILTVYLDAKEGSVARPQELIARIGRLNEYWGGLTADRIKGEACRDYVKQRDSEAAARRELEDMRAAVKYYKREHGLDVEPSFTLPEKSPARERWLTRSEAARLLWAAYRSPYHKHLVRFILIGLYTGTRHQAILRLQWMPNTTGGWVDVERGVLFRRADRERETKKRRPPIRIPSRLHAHLERWHRQDAGAGPVVQYKLGSISRLEKSFRGARRGAGLGEDVTPHILKHTFCTWLAQEGVPVWEAAGMAGITVEMFEQVYGHHHSDFQATASEALYGNRTRRPS